MDGSLPPPAPLSDSSLLGRVLSRPCSCLVSPSFFPSHPIARARCVSFRSNCNGSIWIARVSRRSIRPRARLHRPSPNPNSQQQANARSTAAAARCIISETHLALLPCCCSSSTTQRCHGDECKYTRSQKRHMHACCVSIQTAGPGAWATSCSVEVEEVCIYLCARSSGAQGTRRPENLRPPLHFMLLITYTCLPNRTRAVFN